MKLVNRSVLVLKPTAKMLDWIIYTIWPGLVSEKLVDYPGDAASCHFPASN